MARKATGTLLWYPSGWHAQYMATVDGERKRVFVDLETKNELIAKRKLAALVAAEERGDAATLSETFEQASERIFAVRERTHASAKFALGYLRNHAFPVIGRIPAQDVTKPDVLSVLEAIRDKGLADQTILHVRNHMAAVYKHLMREGVVQASPVPSGAEMPEALPESFDDRPKAVLSDEELLIGLGYTDPREQFQFGVRERQVMALLSRCVGGMRTAELCGLTWERVRVEGAAFDAVEVVRYKTRRKAARRGSKAVSRQLYPLGDTVLPAFLRYWWIRSGRPSGDALLFPVRRIKSFTMEDRTGQKRAGQTFAPAFRRDLKRAFEAAQKAGNANAPGPNSRRWRELFEGTDDRKPLHFHNSRNAAAIAAEGFERLQAAAKFTGHASGRMLQHYRERAGEIDVVPVLAPLLPDADGLRAVLLGWCAADGLDPALVFGAALQLPPQNESQHAIAAHQESPRITAHLWGSCVSLDARDLVKFAVEIGNPKASALPGCATPRGRAD